MSGRGHWAVVLGQLPVLGRPEHGLGREAELNHLATRPRPPAPILFKKVGTNWKFIYHNNTIIPQRNKNQLWWKTVLWASNTGL